MNSTEEIPTGLSSRAKRSLVIIALVGIVVVAALLVYGILVTPARQPYRTALAQYTNVDIALGNTSINLNASTASDADFNKGITAIKTAFTSLGKENDALAKETVLTSGEGKTLYDAYNAKLQAYITYNNHVIASLEKVRPVLYACSNDMNSTTTGTAAQAATMASCATKMKAVSNVPDTDYQQLADSFAQDYGKLATVLGKIAALKDPKGADAAQNAALTTQYNDIMTQYSTDGSTFSNNVKTHRQAVLTTDTAKALHDWLNDKSKVF